MTRYGVLALVAGTVAIAIGRTFGVIELFVIGAGFLGAVAAATLFIATRTPHVAGRRHVHPTLLVAGDTGRVDLDLAYRGAIRSTRFALFERVRRDGAPDHVAELSVDAMAPRSHVTAGYQLPTSTRGVIELGPLHAEVRDPLGLLRRRRLVAGTDQVMVVPRAHLLALPRLGSGTLGRHLLAQARRLGPGEFHSLREYIDGDEPRSIHWRASARSEKLLVKQHAVESLRRMLVVLDSDRRSYADGSSFERAITVAASLVSSATSWGLVTRFVTGDADLRGPDVAADTLSVLARLQAGESELPVLDHDPGEGVGLLVVIAGGRDARAVRAARSIMDPTQATLVVTTDETSTGSIDLSARTEAEFLAMWRQLVGSDRGRMNSSGNNATRVAP